MRLSLLIAHLLSSSHRNTMGPLRYHALLRSGTTLTQDGGGAFGSSTSPNSPFVGFSPSANVIDLGVPSDGSSYGISRYTYSAGAVTNTWNRIARRAAIAAQTLWNVDATNRVYYLTDGTLVQRLVLNAGGTDFTDQQMLQMPAVLNSVNPGTLTIPDLMFVSDNEAIAVTARCRIYMHTYVI